MDQLLDRDAAVHNLAAIIEWCRTEGVPLSSLVDEATALLK